MHLVYVKAFKTYQQILWKCMYFLSVELLEVTNLIKKMYLIQK